MLSSYKCLIGSCCLVGLLLFPASAHNAEMPLSQDSEPPEVGIQHKAGPAVLYSAYLAGNSVDVATAAVTDREGNLYVAGWTTSNDFPVTSGASSRPPGMKAFIAKWNAGGAFAYCNYFGGSGNDRAFGIAVDTQGSVYVAGSTTSADFPVLAAFQSLSEGGEKAFVAKFAPDGRLLYSTYLGGSGSDMAMAIAVDAAGSAYVTGATTSPDFPLVEPLQSNLGGAHDAFVTKLSPDGSSLMYSTYLGGSADDYGYGIALDATGSAYITGGTMSGDFPTRYPLQRSLGGGEDAFVVKLAADGHSLMYGTYLGGSGGSAAAPEAGRAIVVDANGSAYITGTASSVDFPILKSFGTARMSGGTDAFVAQLTPSGGSLVYSTRLGGNGVSSGMSLALDGSQDAVVAGYTSSRDFPMVNAAQTAYGGGATDAFLTRLSADGATLLSSTYWGGSGTDAANALTIDASGNMYVAGDSSSNNLPSQDAIRGVNNGHLAAFVAKFTGTVVEFSSPLQPQAVPASMPTSEARSAVHALAMIAPSTQSVVLSGSVVGTFSIPNGAPFASVTNYWVDGRIHNYTIAPCGTMASTPLGQNNPMQLRFGMGCFGGSDFSLFLVSGSDSLNGGVPVGLSPPHVAISSITTGTSTVLSLKSAPFSTVMSVGQPVAIYGVTNCAGLNATQTVTAITNTTLTVNYNSSSCSSPTGGSVYSEDIVFRATRYVGNGPYWSLELWNADSTGYEFATNTITSVSDIYLPNSDSINAIPAAPDMAYFRWCGGTIAQGSQAPWGGAGQACPGGTTLADWEFEDSSTTSAADSSGNGITMSFSPAVTHAITPVYPPACVPGNQQSFRTGVPASLDGSRSYPLDGGASLAYLWQQIGSAQTLATSQSVTWNTAQSVASPVFSGFQFGPLNFQLTVTQSNGQSTSCELHDGAVSTDTNGNVVLPNSSLGAILGPLTQWQPLSSAAPARWSWFDQIEQQWADLMGGLQGTVQTTGSFVDSWNVPQAGTVSITNGETTITGTGTSFRSVLCGGGATPPGDSWIVIWYPYPIAGGGGGTGRRWEPIGTCNSDTSATLGGSYAWNNASVTGASWAVMYDPDIATWMSPQGPDINYYDNVLAFYAMYYRTGIDTYLGYARWLADRWWTVPEIDRGNCTAGSNGFCKFPRLMEMTGMYLRAMEQDTLAGEPNSSPMWAGIRVLTDTTFRYKLVNGTVLGDLREEGYNDMFVALCAAYDPYAPHAAACRSDLNAEILNTWEPQRQPDGSWSAVAGLYASPGFNSSFPDVSAIEPGTVTVAPGSVAVTISGGTWNPSWFSDPGNTSEFFSVYTPTDYTTRDSVTYVATYVDSTHLQLNQPYVDACSTGTNSCSGRQWILSSNGNGSAWVGFGIQPFMLGIDGDFFLQAYYGLSADPNHAYASTAALVKGYVSDVANWIVEHGYDPATRGLRYGVGFGVCNPGTIAQGCLDDTTPARELTPEAMGALVSAYALAPNPTLLGSIDNLFSALYAKYRSDPGYDGTYAQDLDPLNSGYFWGTDNAKWNGFFWGMGRTAGWLSARQGATLPVR